MSSSTCAAKVVGYISSKHNRMGLTEDQYFYAGNKNEEDFYAIMKFSLSSIPKQVTITKAILKLNATTNLVYGTSTQMAVHTILSSFDKCSISWANPPAVDQSAIFPQNYPTSAGVCEWDITSIVSNWINGTIVNNGILLKDSAPNSMREFLRENSNCKLSPTIRVELSNAINLNLLSRTTYEKNESYRASNSWTYSDWSECSDFTSLTYFVSNEGTNEIDFFVQSSPNAVNLVDSNGGNYIVRPNHTKAAGPTYYAFYQRIAFRTTQLNTTSNVKIILQGQV